MQTLSAIAALLLSVLLLIAGNSLISLVAPVRADLEGFGDLSIGLLGSAYFAGMLAGTLATPAIVRRVGHIRAFAAFVAFAIVAAVLMPIAVAPLPWLGCRALMGFVFAGIYAVIEAWINAKADNQNRGALYGVYQIVNFAASAGGQLLLRAFDPRMFAPFAVSAALLACGIAPLALTSTDAPEQPRTIDLRMVWLARLVPVSVAAAFVAGAANGAASALGALYALRIGLKPVAVPLFTAALALGSALSVYPVGRLSDWIDRRWMIVVAMGAGAAFEAVLAYLAPHGATLVALGFLIGLTTYTLYTLATSHANDRVAEHEMVQVSSSLLFVYSLGAIAAPALASALMSALGPSALFVQNAALHFALVGFTLWRIAGHKRAGAPAATVSP